MDFIKTIINLFEGFGTSVIIFNITLILSLPLGLLISLGSMSNIKIIKYIFKGFVWVIRGTPLMLQVLLVTLVPYYVFGVGNTTIISFFGIKMKSLLFVYASMAFILNYACYFSEIFRGAIEGMPRGQYEAG